MTNKIETLEYDIVIIGAGGAGLMASFNASNSSLSVASICKTHPLHSHTTAAQGGINAALGNINKDQWQWHMYDTIKGGDWISDQDSVELMCQNAPKAIKELEQLGVLFSRTKSGTLDQRKYGGQSSNFGNGPAPNRACFAADRTGHTILNTLYQKSLENNIHFFCDHFAINLNIKNNVCHGIIALDLNTGNLKNFKSRATIIATGGYGQAYETNTSSSICTGDGNALIAQANLPLQDMEFIQFHPTGIHGSGFLITEAARSEGGILINNTNKPFMQDYAPKTKDLAPRDIISRAIANEIREGRGVGNNKDHLLLQLSHLDKDTIIKRLPTVLETAKKFANIDATKESIPISPSVHYTMGGIPTNARCQVISDKEKHVLGLYAIGESACISIHGANRLGCNSLLDLIIFGKQVINTIKDDLKNSPSPAFNQNEFIDQAKEKMQSYFAGNTIINPKIKKSLKSLMSKYFGIIRNGKDMDIAIVKLEHLFKEFQNSKTISNSLVWNEELIDMIETNNLFIQSLATAYLANNRCESRGSHYRKDFSTRNDKKWRQHSVIRFDTKFKPIISYRKVRKVSSNKYEPISKRNY